METAKSKTWVLNVAQTREFQRFFHPAQQENGLCCRLSEDFVHWLCLPLSPLEFLHIKKKENWNENETPPPLLEEMSCGWIGEQTQQIIGKSSYVYIKIVSRTVCLSFRPGACWDVADVGALWSDPGGHYSWRLQTYFPSGRTKGPFVSICATCFINRDNDFRLTCVSRKGLTPLSLGSGPEDVVK